MRLIAGRGSTADFQRSRVSRSAVAVALTVGIAVGGQPADAATINDARQAATPNAVLQWNAHAGDAAITACISPLENPLHESRAYAMTHIAVHDALNAIDRRYQPYAFRGRARAHASAPAAVAAAARRVLATTLLAIPAPFPPECGQAGAASVEEDYIAAIGAIPDGPAKQAGIGVGTAAADAILASRENDGSDTPLIVDTYPQGTAPGEWRFTPERPFAFAPGWGSVTPFALADSAQFLPGPPPAVTSRRYTRDFREVKRLGGDDVTTPSDRTADQTETALFWLESSPLGWNRIARTVSASRHLDLWESARLFGLLNMALADGYIASFTTKYHYNYWRPVTAIRAAGDDGNPSTTADATWTPLAITPPIPDYESAHAVEGAAAVAVLQDVLGTDRVRFSTCSLTLPEGSTCSDPTPVYRQFRRLSQAAAENGESRILVGFHFRTAVEKGLDLGEAVGDRTARRYLTPLRWR
jgi:hypothetical protein